MLKGWNGRSQSQISSLASLSLESLKKPLKNQREGVREPLLGFESGQVRNESRERECEGVWGYLYPTLRKVAVAQQLPGDPDTLGPGHSGLKSGLSGPTTHSHSRLLLCGIMCARGLSLVLFVFLEH